MQLLKEFRGEGDASMQMICNNQATVLKMEHVKVGCHFVPQMIKPGELRHVLFARMIN